MSTSGRLSNSSMPQARVRARAVNTGQVPGSTGDTQAPMQAPIQAPIQAPTHEQRTGSIHPARHRPAAHGSISTSLYRWPKLLARLGSATQDIAKRLNSRKGYVAVGEVEVNATGVKCPKANIVTTEIRQEDGTVRKVNLHANRVLLACPANTILGGAIAGNTYIVGQSPIPDATRQSEFQGSGCEKFLLQGLESGVGTFQFVSPPRPGNPNKWSSRSIVSQLKKELGQNSELLLGGRYLVDKEALVLLKDFHAHQIYRLRVTDVTVVPPKKISITLTQVGMQFENKVLRAKEIRKASQIMDDHRDLNEKKSPHMPEPIVVSHAGIGRSATLVVYRELSARIKDGTVSTRVELQQALEALILQGREARGPLFVHSDEQVRELADTLLAELDQKNVAVVADDGARIAPIEATCHLETDVPVTLHLKKDVEEVMPNREAIVAKVTVVTAEMTEEEKVLADQLRFGRVERSNAGKAFTHSRFKLRDNNGGGNCLFHALAGTARQPSLNMQDMQVLRNRVADVLKNKEYLPGYDRQKVANTHAYNILRQQNGLEPKYEVVRIRNGIAVREDFFVSNEELADAQRELGNYAGDMEIQQWLELEENKNKTVVVIDAIAGGESIITFSNGKRVAWELGKQDPALNEREALEEIKRAVAAAVGEEHNRINPADRQHLALYRTAVHWQAITGVRSNNETASAAREKAKDIAEQHQLAKYVDISELQ